MIHPFPPFRCLPRLETGLALFTALSLTYVSLLHGDPSPLATRDLPIGPGWARTSVNAVIFRTHAVTTFGDTQYASYYDPDGNVILARRQLGTSDWEVHETGFKGNTRDAHNAICIGVDGDGYIHLSWDHHGHPLNYRRSIAPGRFEFSEPLSMTGKREERVTYPEFYNHPDGGLIFMYRDGSSGAGATVLNRYNTATREWTPVQHPVIDGEGQRNGYTNQLAIDHKGRWHLSWTWRGTGDVATNHNILYAMSPDEGKSWFKSTGEEYALPITYATAEVVAEIPQNSELINQCTMDVDSRGHPMIASYWRAADSEVPQYHLVWYDGGDWHISQISERTTPFRLSGGGTRRIPISRPQLAVDKNDQIFMIFRDEERGSRISVATTTDPKRETWTSHDLTAESVDLWEPSYDTQLWKRDGVLHIFKQRVGQGQQETLEEISPQPVSVLEWNPSPHK